MKLTYRGIHYTLHTPTVTLGSATPIAITVGKYRGTSYSIPQVERTVAPRSTINLKYRGAHYYPATNLPGDLVLAPT